MEKMKTKFHVLQKELDLLQQKMNLIYSSYPNFDVLSSGKSAALSDRKVKRILNTSTKKVKLFDRTYHANNIITPSDKAENTEDQKGLDDMSIYSYERTSTKKMKLK